VLLRAVLATPYFKSPSAIVLRALDRIAFSPTACPNAQASARSMLEKSMPLRASDFPYNKSFSGDVALGGSVAGIDLTADLFLGTNLDCQSTPFNFEVSAESTATASLFGQQQQVFDAQIIYGQDNNSPLADTLFLSVWGNTVYNQAIPTLDCESGSYPLAQIAPGFNVEHTLWVSIIPVVFSAGANLELTLTWGWNVCPTGLSASIDVDGVGSVELAGSSFTDLILLRAGFQLNATFNAGLIPQAFVQGTACQAGLEVDENNEPMAASITSYFEWRHCKLIFFDCKWGDYNQQTWWDWSAPEKDTVLFQQIFQI